MFEETLMKDILSLTRERFAAKTSFKIMHIEGRHGIQLVLVDIDTNQIIKRTSLAKLLSKYNYKFVENLEEAKPTPTETTDTGEK